MTARVPRPYGRTSGRVQWRNAIAGRAVVGVAPPPRASRTEPWRHVLVSETVVYETPDRLKWFAGTLPVRNPCAK